MKFLEMHLIILYQMPETQKHIIHFMQRVHLNESN